MFSKGAEYWREFQPGWLCKFRSLIVRNPAGAYHYGRHK